MTPESFFHVAIKADDLESTVAFYRDVLGGDPITESDPDDEETYVALEVADKRVYVFERAPYEIAGLVEELPTGVLHFGFTVDSVDRVAAELGEQGVEFLMEPTTFDDLRVAFCYDPTGARVELLEIL